MNIVITGASRGIGYETAILFSKDKNNKIICVSRKEFDGPNPYGNIFSIKFDLQNGDIGKTLLPEIKKHIDSLDILINNAGTLINKPFVKLTDEDWQTIFEVNLFAPAKLIRLLLPLFTALLSPSSPRAKSKGGEGPGVRSHILNISSIGGFQGSSKYPGLSAYSASKGALAIFTECLAVELAEKNIAVNCLCPGGVQTEMFESAFPGATAAMTAKQMAEKIYSFSLSAGKLMTGKIIPVSLSNP